jgi:hypothetical protein
MIARRLLFPLTAICALAVALALATTAAAERKGGEAESPIDLSLPGEVDVLKASAVYDLATGTLTTAITTREALGSNKAEGAPLVEQVGGLATVAAPCTQTGVEEEVKAGGGYPTFSVLAFNITPSEFPSGAFSMYSTEAQSGPLDPSKFGPATQSTTGTTTTFVTTDARAVNGGFTCVEVGAAELGGVTKEILFFPLAVLPEPPPPAQQEAPKPPAPPAPPTPAALSSAKLGPLSLKPYKWTPVRIKLTNTGETTTVAGSLRLKLPRGLKVRPASARQQIPAIAPGQSWTVAFRVKPTEKAKRRSTISFVATVGAVVARGSVVAKLAG